MRMNDFPLVMKMADAQYRLIQISNAVDGNSAIDIALPAAPKQFAEILYRADRKQRIIGFPLVNGPLLSSLRQRQVPLRPSTAPEIRVTLERPALLRDPEQQEGSGNSKAENRRQRHALRNESEDESEQTSFHLVLRSRMAVL